MLETLKLRIYQGQQFIKDIENALLITKDSEQRAFYRKILNLKLQMEQEKVVGERLV